MKFRLFYIIIVRKTQTKHTLYAVGNSRPLRDQEISELKIVLFRINFKFHWF